VLTHSFQNAHDITLLHDITPEIEQATTHPAAA
jgi:hypothetical protein